MNQASNFFLALMAMDSAFANRVYTYVGNGHGPDEFLRGNFVREFQARFNFPNDPHLTSGTDDELILGQARRAGLGHLSPTHHMDAESLAIQEVFRGVLRMFRDSRRQVNTVQAARVSAPLVTPTPATRVQTQGQGVVPAPVLTQVQGLAPSLVQTPFPAPEAEGLTTASVPATTVPGLGTGAHQSPADRSQANEADAARKANEEELTKALNKCQAKCDVHQKECEGVGSKKNQTSAGHDHEHKMDDSQHCHWDYE